MEISIINFRDNLDRWDLVVNYMKLRKLIFKDAKQWNLVVAQEMEFEQYDTFMTLAHGDKSSYIIAHSGVDVLGGGRLIRCDNPNSYMLRDAYFGKLEGLPKELCDKEPPVNDTTWELTRLISKEKSNLASTILSQTNEFLYSKGVMHKHAKQRIKNYKPFSQSVQPWQFETDPNGADNVKKRTCLWLRGLEPLKPTGSLDGLSARSECHNAPPSKDRWKFRSRFFNGIANAMADQWGQYEGRFQRFPEQMEMAV